MIPVEAALIALLTCPKCSGVEFEERGEVVGCRFCRAKARIALGVDVADDHAWGCENCSPPNMCHRYQSLLADQLTRRA